MTKIIRAVDLFCGGGGLSLGFDLTNESTRFQTVLGIDIDPAAIRIFNDNFKADPKSAIGLGRAADLTWFSHSAEIQAFYLAHLSEAEKDSYISSALSKLGFYKFLARIRMLDEAFKIKCEAICSHPDFVEEVNNVDKAVKTLAIVKTCASKLGIESLIKPSPSSKSLPWTEDYTFASEICTDDSPVEIVEEILSSSRSVWSDITERLLASSQKEGKGQNKKNGEKTRLLANFLLSKSGSVLRDCWLNWKASRDSLRATYFLTNSKHIRKLYDERKVGILLGGPPCKGFSRIGRPVIASLREQGVHAWSHHEYGDERNALMVQYVLFVEALEPDAFIFENVANFESTLKTPAGQFNAPDLLMELIDNLSTNGAHYHVAHRQLNAKDFSVPQDRRRFIMLGLNSSKAEKFVLDEFFKLSLKKHEVCLNTALWGLAPPVEFAPGNGVSVSQRVRAYDFDIESLDLGARRFMSWVRQPDFNQGEKTSSVDGHVFRKMRNDDKAFLRYVAPGIRWMDLKIEKSKTLIELQELFKQLVSIEDEDIKKKALSLSGKINDSLFLRLLLEHTLIKNKLPEQHLLLDGYLKNGAGGHGDWLERLSAVKPCKTVVAHIGKDTYGYFHPYEDRAITIREAARVQSFPDFFKFGAAGVVDAYTVIGNAVAPLMANVLAKRLLEIDSNYGVFTKSGTTAPIMQAVEQIGLFATQGA